VPAELISIVVPVYNEEATIGTVIRLLLTMPLPAPREIIVVNDGSRDGTRKALEALQSSTTEPGMLDVVHLPKNRGKGHAVRTGFARARGTVIAIQDADLELDPTQLSGLVAPILASTATVVYGSRFLNGAGEASGIGLLGNRMLTSLTNVLYGSSLTDMETCYKVMRTEVARSLTLTCDRFDIEPEITAQLLRRGHGIEEQAVRFSPRTKAAGKKIRWRDGFQAIKVLITSRLAASPRVQT
jgi:glycosyltransferase involved in cell wall biosynthesis